MTRRARIERNEKWVEQHAMVRDRFRKFTVQFVNKPLRDRWNKWFDVELDWQKIDPWKMWEQDAHTPPRVPRPWPGTLDGLLAALEARGVRTAYVIGLGHDRAYARETSIAQLGAEMRKQLEGIVLFDIEQIAVVTNHDGELMLLE